MNTLILSFFWGTALYKNACISLFPSLSLLYSDSAHLLVVVTAGSYKGTKGLTTRFWNYFRRKTPTGVKGNNKEITDEDETLDEVGLK